MEQSHVQLKNGPRLKAGVTVESVTMSGASSKPIVT
jgi:hypothetical protein